MGATENAMSRWAATGASKVADYICRNVTSNPRSAFSDMGANAPMERESISAM